MESSTEEADSRTAAFSRKRKQPSSLNFEQRASDSADKRLKLDPDYNGRRSSDQSGESQASVFSTRSIVSSATTGDHEIEDLDPERASRFGWTTVQTESTSNGGFGNYISGPDFVTEPPEVGSTESVNAFSRASFGVNEARANFIADKLHKGKSIPVNDCEVIASWLQINDQGLRVHDIQHAGLKARILEIARANNYDLRADVAKVLWQILQNGDYRSKARDFLKERYALIRGARTKLKASDARGNGVTITHGSAPTDATRPSTVIIGLIRLDDITTKGLKGRVASLAYRNPRKSLEEILRQIIVHKEPFYKQANDFLSHFYQTNNIAGLRLKILQDSEEESRSLEELEKIMTSTGGFLRPIISYDIADAFAATFSTAVTAHMGQFPDSSYATALLETAKADQDGASARQCLADFISINYVGGYHNTSIHSRVGFEVVAPQQSFPDSSGTQATESAVDAPDKLKREGAASLTLDELETFLPKSSNHPREKSARKKARTQEHINKLWKRPNRLFHVLVAGQLLQLIKAGKALPNARENLNRFVEASNVLGAGYDELQDDQHTEEEGPTLDSATEHSYQPINPKVSFDYGDMTRKAAAEASTDNRLPPVEVAGGANIAVEPYSGEEVDRDSDVSGQDQYMGQYHDNITDSQTLQRRYFHTTNFDSPGRCLSCGKEDHSEGSCPSRRCAHCGAVDRHFSSACPINQRCGRCRQRGHPTASCASLTPSLLRGVSSQCDICGRSDHVEEECSNLWRTFIDHDAPINEMSWQEMRVSCYNCGASGPLAHWGDDCPSINAFDRGVRDLNPTWSKKYADKYTQSTTLLEQRSVAGYGSVPSYQLAMLGEM